MVFDMGVLRKICPSSESLGEKTAYSTDSSTIKGEAVAVTWPSTYDHLKMLLKYASREEIPVVARGGGTSLVGGAVPKNALVIDMSRLNKIKKLYVNEKTVVVQSGVVLDKLNESIAEYKLEFPIKPSSHSACTIGGMIATNASGSQPSDERWMNKWVKDITFLDGTGRVYTLDKAEARRFIGTEGCCGIIIEATLYVSAKSETTMDLLKFADIQSVMARIKELKEDNQVVAIEYINRFASRVMGLGEQDHLIVKYLGKKGMLEHVEAEKLWTKYENIYSTLSQAGFPRVEDILLEKDADKFVDWLTKQGVPCYGRLAVGSVHPHFQNLANIEKVASIVTELKGQMVGEYGVGLLRRKHAPFIITHTVRELKAKYDPKNILNKGKVI
ncbi:FAD-binding oxidoreductase [Nanoarchaeota archaeon]